MEAQNKLERQAPAEQPPGQAPDSVPSSRCSTPELNDLLTAYCFGRASQEEQQRVREHLIECEVCRREALRLEAAVRVLDTDRSLVRTVTPGDVAAAFGLSGRLSEPFGGHRAHCLIVSAVYALLGALCLVIEFAYEFDRYASAGVPAALLAFVWLFGSSLAGLWLDWKMTSAGKKYGLTTAFVVFALAAVALYIGACLILPARGITQLTDSSAPAQTAYQKDLIYHIVVMFFFCLPTLHFVLAMQREMLAGTHKSVFGLLTRNQLIVPPRGVAYPRFTLLLAVALPICLYSIYAHHNLMSKLQPGPYQPLFALLVQVRLAFFYILIVKCLYWYSGMLNEIKRECLLAEQAILRDE